MIQWTGPPSAEKQRKILFAHCYKTVPAMKKHIKCVREGGKTRYSLDLYVLPYDE